MGSARAIIFGAGGHARVVASLLGTDVEVLYATSDGGEGLLRIDDVLSRIDDYQRDTFYVAIGDNDVRERLYDQLRALDVTPGTCVAPGAFVARNAHLGHGVVICPGAVVGAHAELGDNVIVNTLSSVDHDCQVGDHGQLTAGVTFGGTTRAGPRTFFGIKCATVPGVTIGEGAVIMAGSLVTRDVPPRVVAGGYPAKVIRRRDRR